MITYPREAAFGDFILDIKKGVLKPGDKMPPQRELADFLDLNLSTITRTYKLCEKQGLLSARIGEGTYISIGATTNDILLVENKSGKIHLDTIRPLYTHNKEIMEKIKEILKTPDAYRLLEYSTPEDNSFYKQSIIEFLKPYNETIDKENILFATGGQNALIGILIGLLEPGDKVATNILSFPALKGIAKLLNIRLIPLEEKEGRIDIDKLDTTIKQQKIKALYLIPDVHNPTTVTLSLYERQKIADIVNTNKIYIIEDAINRFLVNNKIPSFRMISPKNTIEIISISKFLVPGLRVAYVLTPKELKERFYNAFYNMNLMVAPLNLEIVSKLLNSDYTKKLMHSRQIELKKRNNLVKEILNKYKISYNQYGTICWLELPNNWTAHRFKEKCKKYNVEVFTATKFAIGKDKVSEAIRLCITAPPTIEMLEKGLKIIRSILESQEKSS